jgi:hypothetical protein
LIIPVELLSTGSHYKIDCKCDKCGITKEVIYKNYVKYDNKWVNIIVENVLKRKEKKLLNKIGVEYPIQNKEIKKKIQQTMLDKFGVDNPSKSEKINNKKKSSKK